MENGFTSTWDFEEETWSLPPSNGTEGYIKEKSTGLVLTIVKSKIELKVNKSSNDQKWVRSSPDSDGWFTLTNPFTNETLANKIPESDSYSTVIESK